MKLYYLFTLVLVTALTTSGVASEKVIFSNNFDGIKDWGFEFSHQEEGTRIDGTNAMVVSINEAASATTYIQKDLDGEALFPTTGTIRLSFDFDTTNYTTVDKDFHISSLVELSTTNGNKSQLAPPSSNPKLPKAPEGVILGFGIGGFNYAENQVFRTTLAAVFDGGGYRGRSTLLEAGQYHVVLELTVTGSEGAWQLTSTTTLTNNNGDEPEVYNNEATSFTGAGGFQGLQSISGIKLGYTPDPTSVSTCKTAKSVTFDNLQLVLVSGEGNVTTNAVVNSSEDVIFSSDFSGQKEWGFDDVYDPDNTLISDSDSLLLAIKKNSPIASYIHKDIDGATAFPTTNGTIRLSFDLDTTHYTTTGNDHHDTCLIEISTAIGNKSKLTPPVSDSEKLNEGRIMGFSIGGVTHPDEQIFKTKLNIHFKSIGDIPDHGVSPILSYDQYHVVIELTASGGDGSWNLTSTTTLTDSNGKANTYASTPVSITDANEFAGLHSISGIKIGYAFLPELPSKMDRRLTIDNIKLVRVTGNATTSKTSPPSTNRPLGTPKVPFDQRCNLPFCFEGGTMCPKGPCRPAN